MGAIQPPMLIFGTFTEDEVKLYQGQLAQSSSPPPVEKPQIQFGTLDITSLNLAEGQDVVSKSSFTKSSASSVRPKDAPTKAVRKNTGVGIKKDNLSRNLPNGGTILANGLSNGGVSSENGVRENGNWNSDTALPVVSSSKDDTKQWQAISDLHSDGSGRNECNSPAIDSGTLAAVAVDVPTAIDHHSFSNKSLLPHGLINKGNLCFLNATLQALLSCSPFVQLLGDLRNRSVPKLGFPTLSALLEFISLFDVTDGATTKNTEKAVLVATKALNPTMFDPVLRSFTPDLPTGTSARPRQEDVQEFLSFVMDQMHAELLKLHGRSSNSTQGLVVSLADDDDGWETVGRKNKSAVTRTQSFVPSELSAIFGGQLHSVVKAEGNKPSATVEPFLLLHLDIFPDSVNTLDDALHQFAHSEPLEGYRTSAGKAGVVRAHKTVQLHTLPKIMILHLKRFSYGSHGCTKLHKAVHFPPQLDLSRDLLFTSSKESRRYELVSTITHHGRDPSRGHYTAQCRHNDGQWLRYDDASVTPVSLDAVLHDKAYVLFYKHV